jgi:phosphopantetheinyl transferase
MSTEHDKYTLFFVIWSLKEAFIKAIGSGLGFDLTQVGGTTGSYLLIHINDCSMLIAQIDFTVHFPDPVPSPQQCVVSHTLRGHATARIFGQTRADWRWRLSH